MKNLSFILIITLVLSSCDNSSKKSIDEAKNKEILKMRGDSIMKDEIKKDSMSLYAFGDAKFGMSKKEVLKTNEFKGANVYSDELQVSFDKSYIGDKLFDIRAFFYKNKLDKVTIEDIYRSADYYDVDVLPRAQILKDYFTKIYGEPNLTKDIPKCYELKHSDKVDIYYWSIGSKENKTITITIDEDYGSTQFRVTCRMYHNSYNIKY